MLTSFGPLGGGVTPPPDTGILLADPLTGGIGCHGSAARTLKLEPGEDGGQIFW